MKLFGKLRKRKKKKSKGKLGQNKEVRKNKVNLYGYYRRESEDEERDLKR